MARETLGPLRYRVEYEAEFLGRVDAYFDPRDILASVADYALLPPSKARRESVIVGADWGGGSHDPHALVAIGVLDDHGANAEPVLFIPYFETAHRPYREQIAAMADLQAVGSARSSGWRNERRHVAYGPGYEVALVNSESNGVGSMPSDCGSGSWTGSPCPQARYLPVRASTRLPGGA
jgi:hypothetical protein